MDLVIGLLVGLLAFLGSLLGHWISRRNAQEVDTWRKREETMRMLRWATEMATDASDTYRSATGLQVLQELLRSELLQDEDIALVSGVGKAISDTMVTAFEQRYHQEEETSQEDPT